ncbi:hypothetical protein NKH77_17765 [Streptomyces sp. M19]
MYALSEVAALHLGCADGWYHLEPWTVVYVLHPQTGRPLPRAACPPAGRPSSTCWPRTTGAASSPTTR